MHKILLFSLTLGLCQASEVRTWTDNQERKVEASLVRVKENAVVLRLKDGKEVDFPIAKLSADCVKHIEEVRDQLAKQPEESNKADSAEAASFNFDAPWPERISFENDPEVEVIEQDAENKKFVYESANFRYICDVRLSTSVVRGFARMFEATNLYCLTLPLGFSGGIKTDGKYQILLFEKEEDYVKAGGPPDSAGVFISGRNVIMVPFDSLGVRPVGSGYMLDRDKTNKVLPHEITHQLTPECYFAKGSRGWFTEGIAEYVAISPYRSGSFNVKTNLRPIVEYVTDFSKEDDRGRNLGRDIKMLSLETYFLQDYASFLKGGQVSYGSAALLAYYFFHFDGDGDGKRIKAFLQALHDGKEGQDALDVLLDGRSYSELEEEIKKKWGSKRVNFTFTS